MGSGNTQLPLDKIPVLVSGCLLGQKVRFDGGHKHDRYITDQLSAAFDFVSVCPEMAMGLGTPRPTLRLVETASGLTLRPSKDGAADFTDKAQSTAVEIVARLPRVFGAILKKDSPNCGPFKVKVYDQRGMPERKGTGFFAQALAEADPLLPVEDEGRLNDAGLRESFIERVFVYQRWSAMMDEGLTIARLMDFHRDHKYLIMSRPRADYSALGRMVAEAQKDCLAERAAEYIRALMTILSVAPSRQARANMLYHLVGYLKKCLDRDDKQALVEAVETYRAGGLPFAVPLVLLRDYFRRFPNPYIDRQYCLARYPLALGMHVGTL